MFLTQFIFMTNCKFVKLRRIISHVMRLFFQLLKSNRLNTASTQRNRMKSGLKLLSDHENLIDGRSVSFSRNSKNDTDVKIRSSYEFGIGQYQTLCSLYGLLICSTLILHLLIYFCYVSRQGIQTILNQRDTKTDKSTVYCRETRTYLL